MSSLRKSYAKIANQPRKPAFLSLTENGGGVISEANKDFSIVEGRYYFECPPNDIYVIQGFDMHISGATNIKRLDYSDIAGGLINGFDWFTLLNGVETIVTPFGPIKTNEGLLELGHIVQKVDYSASESGHLFGDHLHEFSDGLGLLTPGDRIGVILRDDFSSMVHHEFHLRSWHYGSLSRP